VLVRQGDPASKLAFVVSGELRVLRHVPTGAWTRTQKAAEVRARECCDHLARKRCDHPAPTMVCSVQG
jgi:hypothetical protein